MRKVAATISGRAMMLAVPPGEDSRLVDAGNARCAGMITKAAMTALSADEWQKFKDEAASLLGRGSIAPRPSA